MQKSARSPHAIRLQPQLLILAGYPRLMKEVFRLLQDCGIKHYAIFGGAVRDADYSARHNQVKPIKDYDIRVWLPSENYEQHLREFVSRLCEAGHCNVREVPSAGTGKIRYCTYLDGVELDVSVRPAPAGVITPEAVALDRASDSDIGLSSVALDSLGRAWAMPEYLSDQVNKTLTIYPGENAKRLREYAERMQAKFPDHKLVWLREFDVIQTALSENLQQYLRMHQ